MSCVENIEFCAAEMQQHQLHNGEQYMELSTLSNHEQNDEKSLVLASSQTNRMQVALGIVVRLVVPLFNGVARGLQGIRGINLVNILENVRESRNLLANLLAIAANNTSMSLPSVQVAHKIDPLLRMMKLRRSANQYLESSTNHSTPVRMQCIEEPPEKCVTLDILAEPPPGIPIRADVVFIHGLHGSIAKTWRQGLWNSEGRRVNFKRPPKPPVRPPKRPRHSRTPVYEPIHQSKRPRYCSESTDDDDDSIDFVDTENNGSIDYTYGCDEMLNSDGSPRFHDEFCKFSTFRSRVDNIDDDNDHLSHNQSESNNVPDNDNSVTNLVQEFHDNENSKLASSSDNNNNSSSSSSSCENIPYAACWPAEWLPIDCPGVRVISISYTTDPYLWRPIWIRKRTRSSLVDRAREMMELLRKAEVGHGRPIIWAGHSKGGIFIKQMIVDAWESGKVSLAPIWQSSRGILFYSVPHRGSLMADFHLPFLKQSTELLEISKNCPSILELHRRFVALYRSGQLKVHVFSFVETAMTLMSVLYLKIVGIDSADPGIGEVCGVHLDHREICKPRNRDCILYTELTRMINKIS